LFLDQAYDVTGNMIFQLVPEIIPDYIENGAERCRSQGLPVSSHLIPQL
jgi:hypothetical protein